MFGIFKKKSPTHKLRKQYQSLLEEAFTLSKTDRTASDNKYTEADQIMKQIEAIELNDQG